METLKPQSPKPHTPHKEVLQKMDAAGRGGLYFWEFLEAAARLSKSRIGDSGFGVLRREMVATESMIHRIRC